ncbi:MAG: hypothetical protein AB8F78_04355 [Saprospiraceae bacterium]
MRSFFLVLFALMILFACEKTPVFPEGNEVVETPVSTKSYENVDEILWPYYERFENEAAKRGITVDLTEVHGTLASISPDGVAGDCQYNSDQPNRLRVDLEVWNQVGANLKEYIVFHELGHCDRLRKHREDADADGICVSVMAGGNGTCRENYNAATRDAHLDELFDDEYYGDWQ